MGRSKTPKLFMHWTTRFADDLLVETKSLKDDRDRV